MFEGARVGHRQHLCGPRAIRFAQTIDQLPSCPRIELALHALAVRVQGGCEAALGRSQVAQEKLGSLAHYPFGQRGSGQAPPMQIYAKQKRVVVQHLLEVRHGPVLVDAVPGEAPTELVIHATPRHRRQGPLHHAVGALTVGCPRQSLVPNQKLQHH